MSRRYLSSSFKCLNSNTTFQTLYAKLLQHESFKPLVGKLPANSNNLEPYRISELVNEGVAERSLSAQQAIPIHDKMIEELSKYEYGIGAMHAKRIEQLGGRLSENSIHEMIKYNPGRVYDAWELLQRVPKTLWVDRLLLAAVENTILRNTYEKNGRRRLPPASLAQCLILLQSINRKESIKEELLNALVIYILESKATIALQPLLQYHVTPLKLFVERINELTPYQLHDIYKTFPPRLLTTEKELLFKIINTFGKLGSIAFSEEEIQANSELEKYLHRFGSPLKYERPSDINDFTQDYLDLKNYIIANKLDHKSFKLAQNLLRIEGVHRGNLDHALSLYHSYLSIYKDKSNELMFEIFLGFAYQSYKKSSLELFLDSESFLPADYFQRDIANIVRIQILVNSKFDLGKSLELYNSNIEFFTKSKSSESSLLTESLIKAYLVNQDLDFARVIFEGAVREGVLSSHATIRDLKSLFKSYGDAVEKSNVKDMMQEEILKTIETMLYVS